MNLKTIVSFEVGNDWNSNLLKNPSSTTYQTSNWAQVYHEVYGSKPVFIAIEKPNGELVGQLTTVIHNRYFWIKSNIIAQTLGIKLNLRTYINWFYGPIIYDESLTNEIIHEIILALDKLSKDNNVQMIRGASIPVQKSNTIYKNLGYQEAKWSTYIIDLTKSIDTLFNSLDKNTRYDIRKSEKNDLDFKFADTKDELEQYLNLKYDSIERGGGKIIKNSKKREKIISAFNNAHWNLLHKKGLEKLFLVKQNDELLGGITCFTFNQNMFQHGVGNSSNTKLLGGTFLTWNAIKWGIENRFHNFDLGGVNPNPSSTKEQQIDFYKSKWGGQKLDYVVYTKTLDKLKVKLGAILENPNVVSQKITHILRNGL